MALISGGAPPPAWKGGGIGGVESPRPDSGDDGSFHTTVGGEPKRAHQSEVSDDASRHSFQPSTSSKSSSSSSPDKSKTGKSQSEQPSAASPRSHVSSPVSEAEPPPLEPPEPPPLPPPEPSEDIGSMVSGQSRGTSRAVPEFRAARGARVFCYYGSYTINSVHPRGVFNTLSAVRSFLLP